MKRFVLFISTFFFSTIVFSQARYWVGLSGGLWSDANNWSIGSGGPGGAGSPTNVQDAIFDNSFNGTVSYDLASITINSLSVISSANVTLSLAGATGRTLTCDNGGAASNAFFVQTGTTFTLTTTTNSINFTLSLANNSKGQIDGVFIAAGAVAAGNGGRIDVNTGILTVNGTYQTNIGATNFTGATTTNTTFNTGSVYEINKNGGSFPNAIWNSGSLARHTGMVSGAPTFLGSTYANLEWNCTGQTSTMTLSANLSFNNVDIIHTNIFPFRLKGGASTVTYTLIINGNLFVSANSILETTGTTTTDGVGIIQVRGNIVNNGIIRENSSLTASNQFELNGTSNQNISGSGSWTGNDLKFIMNNAAGATLLSPLILPYELTLTNGKIKTDATNILTLAAGSFWTGASPASFVEGPMRRTGAGGAYSMPIGKGSIYAELGYFSGSGYALTDTFTAEYFRSNPQSIYGNNYESLSPPNNIDHISYVEYWSLQKNAGAFPGTNVRLNVSQYSFCTDSNMDSTFIVRYNAPDLQWKNSGNAFTFLGAPVPPYVTGYIESTGQSLLGIFTLATSLSFAANPLPINLISFDATKLTNTKSSLNWELAACCSAAAKFEIQRAGADKSFTTIGTVGGSETNKSYNYFDNGLKMGINYYRLKMIDADGKITYSRTLAVMNGVNGLLLTSLIPTIVTNTAELTIASSNLKKLDLIIVDMQGRVMLKRNYTIAAGNTNIGLQLDGLAAGVYQLTGISAESKTNTIRFIKQ